MPRLKVCIGLADEPKKARDLYLASSFSAFRPSAYRTTLRPATSVRAKSPKLWVSKPVSADSVRGTLRRYGKKEMNTCLAIGATN